jgi:hypothetical protein
LHAADPFELEALGKMGGVDLNPEGLITGQAVHAPREEYQGAKASCSLIGFLGGQVKDFLQIQSLR